MMSVTINKDTLDPSIDSMITPLVGSNHSSSPSYSLTITEENLEETMQKFLFEDPGKPVIFHARIEKTPCLPLVAPGAPLQDMIMEDLESEGGFDASAAPS